MKSFIEVNTPARIEGTVRDIETMCDILLFELKDSEDVVGCLRILHDIREDYNALKEISNEFNQKAA